MKRTDERAEFLATVLTTAIEGGINYWAEVTGYRWGFHDLGQSDGSPLPADQQAYVFATVYDDDEVPTKVDIETIARGLGLVRDADLRAEMKSNIALADRTNGADGDIDAADADAILQLGMFGEVIYG